VKKEHFENVSTECPTEAARSPDGKIIVQPGNRSFDTMNDYVRFLQNLSAKGSSCIPPKVLSQPIPGILGGLETESEHPEAIQARTVLDYDPSEERAYSNTPINKLSEYDGDSKRTFMNALTLDWANLPFQSDTRAKKEIEFVSNRMEDGFRDPETGVLFQTVEGSSIVPPDTDAIREREQAILSSYQPTDLTKHTVDNEMQSVAKLVNGMYKQDPNWEPVVKQIGEHQWEIAEIRPKARKETYADEHTKATALTDEHMKPTVSIDDHNRLDPYFDKSGIVDKDNNRYWKYDDFRRWTPGLERMFAPTLSNTEWK
jgi:hypothetical protein